MNVTLTEIYGSKPRELDTIHQQLIVEKMKLDKFFSIFLDNSDLEDEDYGSDDWLTYKSMLENYKHINHLLNITTHKLKHHN